MYWLSQVLWYKDDEHNIMLYIWPFPLVLLLLKTVKRIITMNTRIFVSLILRQGYDVTIIAYWFSNYYCCHCCLIKKNLIIQNSDGQKCHLFNRPQATLYLNCHLNPKMHYPHSSSTILNEQVKQIHKAHIPFILPAMAYNKTWLREFRFRTHNYCVLQLKHCWAPHPRTTKR